LKEDDMATTVTITAAQLAYVLANTDGCTDASRLFGELTAKAEADANADARAKVPSVADVDELFDMAAQAGLHPLVELDQVRAKGRYRIRLDGEGYYGTFGCIYVSARTGKLQRALIVENRGDEITYTTAREVRAVLTRALTRVTAQANGWTVAASPAPARFATMTDLSRWQPGTDQARGAGDVGRR
jgi:hypothetical protein